MTLHPKRWSLGLALDRGQEVGIFCLEEEDGGSNRNYQFTWKFAMRRLKKRFADAKSAASMLAEMKREK